MNDVTLIKCGANDFVSTIEGKSRKKEQTQFFCDLNINSGLSQLFRWRPLKIVLKCLRPRGILRLCRRKNTQLKMYFGSKFCEFKFGLAQNGRDPLFENLCINWFKG